MRLNSIDFVSSSNSGTEAGAGARTDVAGTPSAFGKFIHQAMAQRGGPAQTATDGQALPEQDSASPLEADTGLALPDWTQAIMVQQVAVGPNIQAITPSTPMPDDHSLAAFAKAQGLDGQAIAWLLSGHSETAPQLGAASPMTASGLNTALAGMGTTGAGITGVAAGDSPSPGDTVMAAALLAAKSAAPQGDSAMTLTVRNMAGDGTQDTDAMSALSTLRWAQLGATNPTSGATASNNAPSTASTSPAGLVEPAMATAIAAAGASAVVSQRTPGSWLLNPGQTRTWHESELQLGGSGLSEDLLAGLEPQGLTDSPAASAMSLLPDMVEGPVAAREHTPPATTGAPALNTSAATASSGTTAAQTLEQMEQLSQKMADAIGERLMREIDRGHWNVRLMLKPAHLGHIEVEMRLHAGALDASFTAPQAQTRELLQDGLTRLKESLAQMGMDVANLDVRNGQKRQNGENPTRGSARALTSDTSSAEAETTAAVSAPQSRPRSADGWDVTV